ncbi:MAG: DUF1592 domain-containing protein [Verrucomicrobiales bacterium]|nr:DUF1592 domain-containing protein [Verrucomicrobiales bacterium]
MRFRSTCFSAALISCLSGSAVSLQADNAGTAFQFIGNSCLECHDESIQEGERNFEEITFPIEDEMGIIAVQEIIDQLNLGTMPPKDADQPGHAAKAKAIAALTAEVADAHARLKSTGGQTILRRLNEREYLNTLEDLFSRRVDTFAPTSTFPTDQTDGHIDTIGDTLVTSGFLLDNYFEAADLVVEKALGKRTKPKVRTWKFTDNFTQGQELSFPHRSVYKNEFLCVYEVPNTTNHEGGYAGLERFPEGVHEAGFYEVKVLAHSMHRDTPYDPNIFRMDLSEPFRLGIVSGDARIGELHHPQPIEPQLDEVTVADGEPQWYTMKVWLEKGQQPRFIFPNGMANCRQAFAKIAKEYRDHWPADEREEASGIFQARRIVLTYGKMPHIRMHEVEIKGPLYDTWPPAPHRIVFGKEGFQAKNKHEILHRFAERAFRRPVSNNEIQRFIDLTDHRIEEGHSSRQATLDGIKAILCAPSFLYFDEAAEEQKGRLNAWDLASRLSYFLTASLPDEPLRKLAATGEILEKDVIRSETRRLLDSPRSDEFIEGFLESWLNYRALGDQPPDRNSSAAYYYDDLEAAMKTETQYFLRDLISTDGSIVNLLDSDYTFLNRPLARLYRIDNAPFNDENAYHFKRVSLPNSRRGGLLGMGGVLTVSANGIETSPVVRGVYVMENILGTPPPPPPDDVPALEPDVRGATSIRDQLAKHRSLATCADCHRKIDPPGFALENFDPIGRWRSSYPQTGKKVPAVKIDSSGELYDGSQFTGIDEFKELLLSKKDQFTKNLAERLLSYGAGRRIELLDRPRVDKIVAAAKKKNYGMRTLLEEVVTSEIFLSR